MHKSFLGFAMAGMICAGSASAATLIDDTTMGLYNSGIGNLLNGTDPFWVAPSSGDPTTTLATAPDISAAAAELGDWLTTPANPGGTWSLAPVSIPSTWTLQSETAIIYEIDGGTTGLTNVIASIGVDNGVAVWLNGAFIGGDQAGGVHIAGEYNYVLGDLAPGANYLQILREDHGGRTGWTIDVSGDAAISAVPLPASVFLLLAGFGGLAMVRRRA